MVDCSIMGHEEYEGDISQLSIHVRAMGNVYYQHGPAEFPRMPSILPAPSWEFPKNQRPPNTDLMQQSSDRNDD